MNYMASLPEHMVAFMRTRDGGQTWHKELHASLLHPDDIAYLEED